MAAGTFTIYNSVSELAGDGTIDFDTDAFNLILVTSSYTPNLAHDEYADVSGVEVANGNGYTTGGVTLANVTWTRSSGVTTFDSDDAVWTASGGSITARYAIMVDTTSTNDKLIGYVLLDTTPADLVATNGNTLTVSPHATTGWFQQTVNPA